MAKRVKVKLRDPFPGHGGQVTEVELREPLGIDFIELGEPYTLARADKGMIVHAENDIAVKGYLERCFVKPDPLLAMSQLSLADMISVKEALLNFFIEARAPQSVESSSSLSATSDGSAPTGRAG